MGESVIEAVVDAVGTTGADIMLIAAAIIIAIQLAMLAYRYVGRLVGVSHHKIGFGDDAFDRAPLSGTDPDEYLRGLPMDAEEQAEHERHERRMGRL